MNDKFNVSAEVKADLTPIIDSTPKGLGKLFDLVFGEKYARKRRVMTLIDAQAKVESNLIDSGDATFNCDSHELIIENKRISETNNMLKCVNAAAKSLMDDIREPQDDISIDFFNRWRNEASLIGTEEAALIWGKILAEEIIKPSSISLRSLDVLKNLSKDEILLFISICPYIVFDGSLLTGDELDKRDMYKLADAGLVVFSGVGLHDKWQETTLTYNNQSPTKGLYLEKDEYLVFNCELLDSDLKANFISLTKAGKDIYQIAKKDASCDLEKLSSLLFSQDKRISEITYFKYTNKEKREIDMDNPIVIKKS